MIQHRCKDCVYHDDLSGSCRCEPPKAMAMPGRAPGELQLHAFYPPTRPENWCGKLLLAPALN